MPNPNPQPLYQKPKGWIEVNDHPDQGIVLVNIDHLCHMRPQIDVDTHADLGTLLRFTSQTEFIVPESSQSILNKIKDAK